MHWWQRVRQLPPGPPAFQESWTGHHVSGAVWKHWDSCVQVKSSPPGNSLINCHHHCTAVQECKVIIPALTLARELPSTAMGGGTHISQGMLPRKHSHPGDGAILLLCPAEIGLSVRACSPPGLRRHRSLHTRAGLSTVMGYCIPSWAEQLPKGGIEVMWGSRRCQGKRKKKKEQTKCQK